MRPVRGSRGAGGLRYHRLNPSHSSARPDNLIAIMVMIEALLRQHSLWTALRHDRWIPPNRGQLPCASSAGVSAVSDRLPARGRSRADPRPPSEFPVSNACRKLRWVLAPDRRREGSRPPEPFELQPARSSRPAPVATPRLVFGDDRKRPRCRYNLQRPWVGKVTRRALDSQNERSLRIPISNCFLNREPWNRLKRNLAHE